MVNNESKININFRLVLCKHPALCTQNKDLLKMYLPEKFVQNI